MKTVALQDLVKAYGEDAVKRILKTFSCKEKNEDGPSAIAVKSRA